MELLTFRVHLATVLSLIMLIIVSSLLLGFTNYFVKLYEDLLNRGLEKKIGETKFYKEKILFVGFFSLGVSILYILNYFTHTLISAYIETLPFRICLILVLCLVCLLLFPSYLRDMGKSFFIIMIVIAISEFINSLLI